VRTAKPLKRRPPPTAEDWQKKRDKERERKSRRQSRKTSAVLARIGRLTAEPATTTEWEEGFLGSVSERLQVFGSAFRDPEKGTPGAPLSVLQGRKLRQIEKSVNGWNAKPIARKQPD